MIDIHRRAADDLDIRALTDERGSLARNLATVTLPVAVVAFGIAYAIRRSVLIAGILAAGLFLASLISNARFFREVRRRKNLMKDASAVEVLEVSASSVFDLEPAGESAPALCFLVGQGQVLLLVGQWLLKYHTLPADSFRIHRWADSREPIRIEVTGRPLEAKPSNVRLRPSHRFGKIEMLNASLETLQEDLDRALVRGARAPA